MKRILFLLALSLIFNPLYTQAQYLVNSELLSTNPSFLLGIIPGVSAEYNVDYYRLTYNTVDVAGEPTVASGGVAIPVSSECNHFPMIVYCHGTVLKQYDVPGFENSESFVTKAIAATGYISIAPDYLGLGENPGIHPYVHAESEATATIDLIRATREFLEEISVEDNGEVFVTGYSQGGQAAMATLKYAEENGLNEELGIVAGAPCSGPYNLSGSQADVLLSDEPYPTPGYVIYLLVSYQHAYGNLYNELGDVIQSPYDQDVAPYFDGQQNQYNMGVVHDLLPQQLSVLFVDSVYANFQNNSNHPLWEDLKDNDTYDWTPEVPIRLYYCSGDEQVSYENSITAKETMVANGATDVEAINVLPGASHGGCAMPALIQAYNFFAGLATPCEIGTGIDKPEVLALELYPNPAHNQLVIDLPEKGGDLYIQSLTGKVVLKTKLNHGYNTVNINELASATYIVWLQEDNGVLRTTKVVVEH